MRSGALYAATIVVGFVISFWIASAVGLFFQAARFPVFVIEMILFVWGAWRHSQAFNQRKQFLAGLCSAVALVILFATFSANADHAKRNSRAKTAFKRQQPCPTTHRQSGPCPGYVIDHITPLACGGPDAPSNMQWQAITEAKAKDRWERRGCARNR